MQRSAILRCIFLSEQISGENNVGYAIFVSNSVSVVVEAGLKPICCYGYLLFTTIQAGYNILKGESSKL